MTTTMISYRLDWTDPDGKTHTSAVTYDKPSAEHRKTRLETEGCTGIVIRQVKPGEL
ncbi:hypothetical protein C9F11_38550 [Streptomyces sp. YIM 121038]|uniref:hypothetical protein n=1 Tax=Streptomyces sp. YIM 121038 TaxID=2136401 RepID=UPI001162FE9E|nr:hypothetical protein [Streptomyces sp. YIM 121038]QCX81293.1 hypothetical protein C9F11_38550 [Streptomyces sp. YIM 121038]